MLLCVGIIQLIFVIATFIFPSIKNITIELLIQNSRSTKISHYVSKVSATRFFGFSDNLLDIFGYSTSILIISTLFFGFFKQQKYILLSILFLLMTTINARTGLLLSAVGCVYIIVCYFNIKFNAKKALKIFILLFLGVIGIIILIRVLPIVSPYTAAWLNNEFSAIFGGITGKNNGISTISLLMSESFWFIPDDVSIIFGNSIAPEYIIGRQTDVGIVNNIWIYGIIGSVLIYSMYAWLFSTSIKSSKSKVIKGTIGYMAIAFVLFMFKLSSLGLHQASIMTFCVCFKSIYDSRNNTNCNKGLEDIAV